MGSAVLSEPGLELTESPPLVLAFGLNTLRRPLLPDETPVGDRPMVELAGRAALAMAARRPTVARAAFDELVARYPSASHVHYARGVLLLSEAPDLAVADFERELTITKGHLLARLQLAFEWLRRGDPGRARPYASEAVEIDPQHAVARLALGQVLLEAGEIDPAVTELESAARLAPESAQTHFLLARAYARARRDADAARERREFERLNARPRGR